VTPSKFHTKNPHMLGARVQNLDVTATTCLVFASPCFRF